MLVTVLLDCNALKGSASAFVFGLITALTIRARPKVYLSLYSNGSLDLSLDKLCGLAECLPLVLRVSLIRQIHSPAGPSLTTRWVLFQSLYATSFYAADQITLKLERCLQLS